MVTSIEMEPSAIERKEDKDIRKVPDVDIEQHDPDIEFVKSVRSPDNSGATMINAVQLIWGKHGKKILIAGLVPPLTSSPSSLKRS
jgi:hypothetical protein